MLIIKRAERASGQGRINERKEVETLL